MNKVIEEMGYQTRCNNCYTYFVNDNGLELFKDNEGYFKGCPKCETDAYLMDLD